MTNNENSAFQGEKIWFQVAIIGLPTGTQLEIMRHLSTNHDKFLPDITENLRAGKTKPKGINYRLVEVQNHNDPSIAELEGSHALVYAVSSRCVLDKCKEVLLTIYDEFSGRVPLIILLDNAINTEEEPINLLGLTKMIELGIQNLRIFSFDKTTGEGLSVAFQWLTSYFSLGDGDIKDK